MNMPYRLFGDSLVEVAVLVSFTVVVVGSSEPSCCNDPGAPSQLIATELVKNFGFS